MYIKPETACTYTFSLRTARGARNNNEDLHERYHLLRSISLSIYAISLAEDYAEAYAHFLRINGELPPYYVEALPHCAMYLETMIRR